MKTFQLSIVFLSCVYILECKKSHKTYLVETADEDDYKGRFPPLPCPAKPWTNESSMFFLLGDDYWPEAPVAWDDPDPPCEDTSCGDYLITGRGRRGRKKTFVHQEMHWKNKRKRQRQRKRKRGRGRK